MYTLVVHLIQKLFAEKITRDFDVTKIEYKFLDRENDLTDIGGGSFKPLTAKRL
jgi:hypothetical protein